MIISIIKCTYYIKASCTIVSHKQASRFTSNMSDFASCLHHALRQLSWHTAAVDCRLVNLIECQAERKMIPRTTYSVLWKHHHHYHHQTVMIHNLWSNYHQVRANCCRNESLWFLHTDCDLYIYYENQIPLIWATFTHLAFFFHSFHGKHEWAQNSCSTNQRLVHTHCLSTMYKAGDSMNKGECGKD